MSPAGRRMQMQAAGGKRIELLASGPVKLHGPCTCMRAPCTYKRARSGQV